MTGVALSHALIAIKDDHWLPAATVEQMKTKRAERTRLCDHLSRLMIAGCAVLEAKAPHEYEATILSLLTLADQLKFQVARHVVPFSRLFSSRRVRGLGPQRLTKLAAACQGEISRIPKLEQAQLAAAVGPTRVSSTREAALDYLGGLTREQSNRQYREVKRIGDSALLELVEALLGQSGHAYEPAVEQALNLLGWKVQKIPEERKGKIGDLEGFTAKGVEVLVECKTTEDFAGEVPQQEAHDVLKKVPDDFSGLAITVGRPVFSSPAVEEALRKRNRKPRFRLVTSGALIELLVTTYGTHPKETLEQLVLKFVYVDVRRVRAEISHLQARRIRSTPDPRVS